MELVIGGVGQGKLDFAKEKYPEGTILRNDLQDEIRKSLKEGRSTQEIIAQYLAFADEHPQTVLICDEIGNGIVPVDPFERLYREETGRVLIALAQKAEHVTRVICGIGQVIK